MLSTEAIKEIEFEAIADVRFWLLADLLRAIDFGLLYPRRPTQDFILANDSNPSAPTI